ncbi:crossover junction endodeoxyribonuclease RuvC [Thermanaeromonas sp. C210]|uniref:crossover junction endodeoxyribonuclease RuvC n=1 Tax=Thermanaeromonas sp. C210 TaxID=2731925 RepID=UPI00155B83E3|nr:crossover junction endodeoxyribonuclease RuvC [Thermanaeromonas sp. C210]GFN23187.1 crossover junction endodeoxyribonuclease RuvC [Thermanaeromonas sp. C210]
MRILGIDPGTATTGYGLIETGREGMRLHGYGCLRTRAGDPLPLRLASLYEQLTALIREMEPSSMAIEELFFNKNVRTALSVGQARGVVLLAAAHARLPVVEYTPLQVKQAVTGYGRAPKDQVQRMVQAILKLPELPAPDDAADALAVAVCHAAYQSFRDQVEGGGFFC